MHASERRRSTHRRTHGSWPPSALGTLPMIVLAIVLTVGVASWAATSAAPDPEGSLVSGTGVHYVGTAIVHAEVPTDGGTLRRSSEIVTLYGDLHGHLLYHPTSTIDHDGGTLVNTGLTAEGDAAFAYEGRCRRNGA